MAQQGKEIGMYSRMRVFRGILAAGVVVGLGAGAFALAHDDDEDYSATGAMIRR